MASQEQALEDASDHEKVTTCAAKLVHAIQEARGAGRAEHAQAPARRIDLRERDAADPARDVEDRNREEEAVPAEEAIVDDSVRDAHVAQRLPEEIRELAVQAERVLVKLGGHAH